MQPRAIDTYDAAPHIVIWEMTRACALACRHCRAEAIPYRNPAELTTAQAFALVDAVVECGNPIFILTGGDPFMRDDLFKIVEYAVGSGLRTAVSPSATGRLRPAALQALSRAGCRRISLSLDAPTAASHDDFRGVRGSFARTLEGIAAARQSGIEVQINTTVSRFNQTHLGEMADLLRGLDVALWSLFFLVPVGRASIDDVLDARETEAAFAELFALAQTLPFPIKTTEAPHYRRFIAQQAGNDPAQLGQGIGDGKGFIFISYSGDVCPSGFLPHVVGNVRRDRLIDVYRDDPFLARLRDPNSFEGKCSVCEFHDLCGGSRARAFTVTGNAFASEPTCAYVPPAWGERIHA